MMPVMVDFWDIDPLPTPPAGIEPGTTEYWRWWSAETLKARQMKCVACEKHVAACICETPRRTTDEAARRDLAEWEANEIDLPDNERFSR